MLPGSEKTEYLRLEGITNRYMVGTHRNMQLSSFARNFARVYGSLWLLVNCVNLWKVINAVEHLIAIISGATGAELNEAMGYAASMSVMTGVIFYCVGHVLLLKPQMRTHVKALIWISLLPVLAKGIIPREAFWWIVFELIPSLALLSVLKRPVPAPASAAHSELMG